MPVDTLRGTMQHSGKDFNAPQDDTAPCLRITVLKTSIRILCICNAQTWKHGQANNLYKLLLYNLTSWKIPKCFTNIKITYLVLEVFPPLEWKMASDKTARVLVYKNWKVNLTRNSSLNSLAKFRNMWKVNSTNDEEKHCLVKSTCFN